MPSKLGPHFIGTPGYERWEAAGVTMMKFDPSSLGASSQVPPGILVVGKFDQQDSNLKLMDWKALMNGGRSPAQAAEERFEAQRNISVGKNKPKVDRYAANSRIDIWEDDNEVVPDDPREAKWFAAYCIEMMKRYDEIGKKRANFNFATGTPDIRPGEEDDIWPHLLPAVRYAHDHGHYLALHEYMGPYADLSVGHRQVNRDREVIEGAWHGRLLPNGQPDERYPYGYCPLRYRYVYDLYLRPEGLADTPLIITECGCDGVDAVTPLDMEAGSWTHLRDGYWREAGLDAEPHYASMLQWYDQRLREDSYVLGAMIFTVGSFSGTRWEDFDIAGTEVERRVLDYIAAERNKKDRPIDGANGVQPTSVASAASEASVAAPDPTAVMEEPETVQMITHGFVNAPDGLNLRQEPSTQAQILHAFPFQTAVQIDSKVGDWLHVTSNGHAGFVHGDFITIGTPGTAPAPSQPASPAGPAVSPASVASPAPAPVSGPRRRSVIGVHGAPGGAAPPRDKWDMWTGLLKDMGVKWYKQCETGTGTGDGSIFRWVLHLKNNGIEPIVRFLVQQQFPRNLPGEFFEQMRRYADNGVVWAEIGNEPNLRYEWQGDWQGRYEGEWPHGRWAEEPRMRWSNDEAIAALARTWVDDATRTADMGMRPAFYAFGPTDWSPHRPNGLYSSTKYTERVVAQLASAHRQRTTDLFKNRGAWIAVHVAKYEQPFDRDPYQEDPNRPWDMTLRGYEVVLREFRRHFGSAFNVNAVPIISTEGGVFTPDHKNSVQANRLPANDEEHARQTVAMYRYVEQHTPLTAMCPWCISEGDLIGHKVDLFRHHGWFKNENGHLHKRPVYQALVDLKNRRGRGMEPRAPRPIERPEKEEAKTVVTINIQIQVEIDGETNGIVVHVNPQTK